jgi:sugar/nucleoside kinase (ribokinase family)
MKSYDILVAGEINPDLVLTGDVIPAFNLAEKIIDSANLSIGSSSAIFACGAARLGLKVGFIGICGDDFFGRFMLEEMTRRDVDIAPVIVDTSVQTGMSVIFSTKSDRAILTHVGSMNRLHSDQVTDDLLARTRHLHVASYFLQTALQPGLPDLFRRARTLGLTVSLDPNWDPLGKWHGFDELLPLMDVFLPNQNEALALTGAVTVEEAVACLSRKCHTVAVKLGERGAIAARDTEVVHTPALKVKVVDTTGAGDSFDGGFLYGFLNGWRLERALKLGAACGSLSTRAVGGTNVQATLEEAMRYVD